MPGKKQFKHLLISIGLALTSISFSQAQLLPNFGGQRSGLSTMSFLKNDMDPRTFSLAGAGSALDGNPFSAVNNPAGLAGLEKNCVGISHIFFGAGIHQSFAGLNFKLKNTATVSLNLNSLNAGNMKVRTEFQPEGNGEMYFVSNSSFGLSYALKLSERFAFGASLAMLYETMAGYKNYAISTDFGFLYNTDFRKLQFAVGLRNFGGNSSLSGEKMPVVYNRQGVTLDQHTLPTVFEMGIRMLAWEKGKHNLFGMLELNHPNDNSENLRIGVEYFFSELFMARLGAMLSVKGQRYPAFGIAYKIKNANKMMFNYGILPTSTIGAKQIVGLSADLRKLKN